MHGELHNGNDREILIKLLTEMVAITKEHFLDEENDLKDKDYPELLLHIDEHKNLVIELNSLKELYIADRLVMDDEVIGFLANWLSVHTVETDSGYSHLF
jgi:hemerythrin-like metal-binding protein